MQLLDKVGVEHVAVAFKKLDRHVRYLLDVAHQPSWRAGSAAPVSASRGVQRSEPFRTRLHDHAFRAFCRSTYLASTRGGVRSIAAAPRRAEFSAQRPIPGAYTLFPRENEVP